MRKSQYSKKTVSKAQTKSIKTLVKSVVQGQAEHKSLYQTWASLNGDNVLNTFNPCYSINQGTTAENVLGEKLRLTSIKVAGLFYCTTPLVNDTLVRVMLVHSRDKLISTSGPGPATTSAVMRAGGSGFIPIDQIDRHKVTVLADKKFTMVPSIAGQTQHKTFNLSYTPKGGKALTFDQDNSGYFKNGQYFIILTTYNGLGSGYNVAARFNTAVNFTDV